MADSSVINIKGLSNNQKESIIELCNKLELTNKEIYDFFKTTSSQTYNSLKIAIISYAANKSGLSYGEFVHKHLN